ncbi:hypothetical protein KO02_00485 [Sphingobacterium sp. ML3W]|uniref:DUF6705 family protein n=1 Tax=Sphingobacterium sp. ML3W TaxID=1538644 RepID=UPI0004F7D1DA|nr:DUF6705 family protein [Sphingobacterium sp. ML3W]AIM35312.1 hypothetical protein KO02_00485 [Sphingobacterium sp. ML3W]
MKNILVIILVVLSGNFIYAQKVIEYKKGKDIGKLEKGAYYKSKETKERSKSFIGTWVYKNGVDFFEIKIEYGKAFLKGPDVYLDMLHVYYCYEKNGIEISCDTTKYSTGNVSSEKPDKASFGRFYDITKDKYGILNIELLNNGNLRWKLENPETIVINGDDGRGGKMLDRSFSIPTDINLTKK